MSMQSTFHWPEGVVQTTRNFVLMLLSSMRQIPVVTKDQEFPPLSQMSIQNGHDWTGQKSKAPEVAAGQSRTVDTAASALRVVVVLDESLPEEQRIHLRTLINRHIDGKR